jgi:hypothetical protein
MGILHTSTFDRAMLPALAGAVFCVASFPPVQGVPSVHRVTALGLGVGNAWVGISCNPTMLPRRLWTVEGFNNVHNPELIRAALPVRPLVREFLKRVVVPILVERYIAGLNRGGLPTRTKGAL